MEETKATTLERRLKGMRVPEQFLHRLMQAPTPTPQGKLLVQYCEAPANSDIAWVYHEPERSSFRFILWCPDWDIVPEGDTIPDLDPVICHCVEVDPPEGD